MFPRFYNALFHKVPPTTFPALHFFRPLSFEMTSGVSYIDSKTVNLIDLAEDCKLLLYVTVKVNKNVRMKSNCSSVWKEIGGNWKIVFHQGTNCCE